MDFALGEPMVDFLLSRFDRVRAVADIAANINTEVSTDGTRRTIGGVGSPEKSSSSFDDTLSFPYLPKYESGSKT